MARIKDQIGELHDATDELTAAWNALAVSVARRLEGIWDDPESRIADARERVRDATGRAIAVLDQALAEGGPDRQCRPAREEHRRRAGPWPRRRLAKALEVDQMARQPTGAVVEHTGRDGRTYRSLRFTAYGKRRFVSLGPVREGDAQRELRHVLADVERGTWSPPQPPAGPAEPELVPTFHEFAEQWWVRNEGQLAGSTRADYRWRLERHLLPFFAHYRLDEITFDLVEQYIAAKLASAEPLSARSINMTLTLMAAILEGAVERELIARNPAKGKSRRVREREPKRSYLETADQIAALLDAAGALDRSAREDRRHIERRAIVATLIFAGLRIG
jgi:hypothetical protein